jgi:hypothetical protein
LNRVPAPSLPLGGKAGDGRRPDGEPPGKARHELDPELHGQGGGEGDEEDSHGHRFLLGRQTMPPVGDLEESVGIGRPTLLADTSRAFCDRAGRGGRRPVDRNAGCP